MNFLNKNAAVIKKIAKVVVGDDMKMVLVVRKDLKMGAGKVAAQAAHAAVGVVERVMEYEGECLPDGSEHPWWAWYSAWSEEGCQKVALQCPDEEALMALQRAAKEKQLPYYLVRDAGRTQIAAGSKTVLAIGPAPKPNVDELTGQLKLL
ncbi:peptidyl-tRNA hydrolase, PTH2 family [Strigomonas culicis]|uniref:peptidyl-tRNA hydrolase n=1 Tax=Strigomonas culicis TaxID=28005 RepID=S9USY5_9TRYP|nr:peptidyl-tRNA hydrolase, PTH2 family [Strigomonas culicis]|eukprot:EPY17646.1 peptidyl-tRNA hydrolase, PTH2 family [Strigomonas culicis]